MMMIQLMRATGMMTLPHKFMPMAKWFEEEQITDDYVDHGDFGPILDLSDSKLFVGALFANKNLDCTERCSHKGS